VSDQFGLDLGEGALVNILSASTVFSHQLAAMKHRVEPLRAERTGQPSRLGGSNFFLFAPYTARLPDDLPKRLPLSTPAVSITRAMKELGHHEGRQVVH